MTPTVKSLVLAIGLLAAAGATARAVTDEQRQRIRDAVPRTPYAEVDAPRHLLVFSLTRGFRHDSIPHGVEALRVMGETTGAFTIEHSEDPDAFARENLARFAAVCFLNTTGELFTDPEHQQSLIDFVRDGGGLVGIHAATDTFYEWPEFGRMMGAYFHNHPWNAHDTVTLRIEEPDHPCNACFDGADHYVITDEIYQFRDEPYSRHLLRVLTSLDTERTDMNRGGIVRTDDDYAVSWIHTYGAGRVFYASIGHRQDIYWNPVVLGHYLAGIQFAMGDLDADATPSAMLDKSGVTIFDQLKAYRYEDDRSVPTLIDTLIYKALGDTQALAAIEGALAQVVVDPKTTLAGFDFACRKLALIGTDRSVPALARFLDDDERGQAARFALEQYDEGRRVGEAMAVALGRSSGATRIGLIHSMGQRREERGVRLLSRLAQGEDREVADAAIRALARIGTEPALRALQAVPREDDALLRDALLHCADLLIGDGRINLYARNLYADLLRDDRQPPHVRAAAYRGLLVSEPDRAAPRILVALEGDDPALHAIAVRYARTLPGLELTEGLATALPDLPAATQLLVIPALAVRGDAAAVPALARLAARGDEAPVRIAALRALGTLEGNAAVARLLLASAQASTGDEQRAARHSLRLLRGEGVDEVLIDGLRSDDPDHQIECIQQAADRRLVAAVPLLLDATRAGEAAVRIAALTALNSLAGPAQQADLLAAVLRADDRRERGQAARALLTVTRQMAPGPERVQPLLTALQSDATTSGAREILLSLLPQLGGEAALAGLRPLLDEPDGTFALAALRALAAWPEADALPHLIALVAGRSDTRDQVLALRGALRLLDEAGGNIPMDRQVEAFAQLLEAVPRDEDILLVLSSLGRVADERALTLATAQQANPAVRDEAERTAQRIRQALAGPPVASASHQSGRAGAAFDEDPGSRWDSGTPMQPGMWFMADLHLTQEIRSVVLDTAGSANDHPRGYELYLSNDPEDFGEPVARGDGAAVTRIELDPPVQARYLRVVQTGSHAQWFWSIHRLSINE